MPNEKASDHAALLRISQMQLLYEQWPVGMAGTLVMAPALVALFWNVTAHRTLIVWFVSIAAVTMIRLGVLWAYRRSAPEARQARSWLGWFLAGIAASGSLWGSVIILFAPNGSYLHLGFTALCLCGLSAGSVAAYAPFKSSFFAFAAPALLPGAIYLAASAKPVELTLSATLFLFFGFVSLNALRVHRTVLRSLQLQFENTELIAQLQAEKRALAGSKEELEQRVTERTGQLARMNVELQNEVIKRRQHEALVVESEGRYRHLYDDTPTLFSSVDREGVISSVNRYGAEELGYTVEELIGTSIMGLADFGRPAVTLQHIESSFSEPQNLRRWETKLRKKDGSELQVRVTARRVADAKRESSVFLVFEDLSERERAENSLRESEQKFMRLVDNVPGAVYRCACDPDWTMEYIDQSIADISGYSPSEFIHNKVRSYASIIHPEDLAMVEQAVLRAVNKREPYVIEYRLMHRDGGLRWVYEKGQAKTENGKVLWLDGAIFDITRLRSLTEQLSYQATHDDLTDLTNRREFEQRLKRALGSAYSEKREHALCYLDLDQFKVVNDTCGHIAGDELLRQLSALLRSRVRQDRDTLARLGGDEFGVLMENCSLRDALRVAHQLKEAVQKYRFVWEGKNFHVGLSMGLIPITQTAGSVTDILKAADAACYAAKDKGRNRIHVYHKDSIELAKWSRDIEWVTRINHALEDNRFHLYCQPIVPLRPDQQGLLHYELLVRLEDEQGHIVLPSVFVPAAERYGLNVGLDRWVLEQTLKSLGREPEHLSRLHLCGINISALSVSDEDFLAFVIQQFEHSTVPPQKLCFEITETAVISNIKNATRFIRALKERGCFFALDDFGSGSSSFAYLKRLPVDFLKIDGLFIKDIADDPVIADMVASINDIGHAMGKKTIAEFVASDAIVDKLRQIGVDYAQGSRVGPTRPLDAMIKPRS
ncbi:MAG: EAL domain-containing protein [Gammaproteobacteria bacterium]